MNDTPPIMMDMEWLHKRRKKRINTFLEEFQPYDIAHLYMELSYEYRRQFLELLEDRYLALLLQELHGEYRLEITLNAPHKKIAQLLNHIDNDDVVALLSELPEEQIQPLLRKMNQKEAKHVKELLAYKPETAGRLMTNRFIWIKKDATVAQTVEKMKTYAHYSETINYLYVVDNANKLAGVVSHRDIILAESEELIEDIMFSRVIAVHEDDDQEYVASQIEKYDFIAIPVINGDGTLLGIITIDDVLDVVIQEANEDIEKLSASGKDITFSTKATVATLKRLPWLILLLLIGIFSGNIISHFELTLHKVVSLAYFMPMIAGMTGNTGTQSLAVTVRGLSMHQLKKREIWKLIGRELTVGILIGLVCGCLIAGIAFIWQGSFVLGLVVGISLFFTLIIGTIAGTIIPIILYKCNIDPAVASGPLITTLNDIFSLLIYFGLATYIYSLFPTLL
ncbi:magnesium transporter [Priestia megaterium]|nr:magnesium transporter [Priestia megaterium]